MQEFQENDFNKLMKDKKSGLVMFGAPWCGACKMMVPEVKKAAGDFKNLIFAKIDVGKNQHLATKMNIMSLPNTLFILSGKIVDQIIGAATQKELEKRLKKIA